MAKIPPPNSHTALAIDAAHGAAAWGGDSAGVPMSAVTHPCDRAIWYAYRWAPEPEKATGARQRRFRTGNQYERWLLDDLRAIGCEVYEVDETTGKQFRISLAGGHLNGKIDAVVIGLPEAKKVAHITECKSHNDKSYKALVKVGVRESKPDHYAQFQLYMHGEGLTRALYMAANKNTDEIHCERVHYDPVFCLALISKIERIVAASQPPAKLHEDPSKKAAFVCQFCRSYGICHGGEFSRVNCRTCISSTPVDGGKWICERHNKELSYKEQVAACPDHLYIPGLVHGEQIDSDFSDEGGTITYQMHDGSTWIDGRRE